jgi:hypothetical protein
MKTINEQINPNFIIQAKKLARLTKIVHSALPVECHDHVSVGGIHDRNLMLITDSPVWTTRLRQLSPHILQYIHDTSDLPASKNIHHVQISTRYHNANAEKLQAEFKQNRHKPQLSEKSALMLSQSADSMNHSALQKALLKLASHAKTSADK